MGQKSESDKVEALHAAIEKAQGQIALDIVQSRTHRTRDYHLKRIIAELSEAMAENPSFPF